MIAYLKASGKSIAASKPNRRWIPLSVLVLEISLPTLLQAELLSGAVPSTVDLFGVTEDPARIGGRTGKRAGKSLPVRASWDEPGGNPVCWLVELFTKFSSHQHFALTPLRLEPSFSIPVVTVSCFVKVTYSVKLNNSELHFSEK